MVMVCGRLRTVSVQTLMGVQFNCSVVSVLVTLLAFPAANSDSDELVMSSHTLPHSVTCSHSSSGHTPTCMLLAWKHVLDLLEKLVGTR